MDLKNRLPAPKTVKGADAHGGRSTSQCGRDDHTPTRESCPQPSNRPPHSSGGFRSAGEGAGGGGRGGEGTVNILGNSDQACQGRDNNVGGVPRAAHRPPQDQTPGMFSQYGNAPMPFNIHQAWQGRANNVGGDLRAAHRPPQAQTPGMYSQYGNADMPFNIHSMNAGHLPPPVSGGAPSSLFSSIHDGISANGMSTVGSTFTLLEGYGSSPPIPQSETPTQLTLPQLAALYPQHPVSVAAHQKLLLFHSRQQLTPEQIKIKSQYNANRREARRRIKLTTALENAKKEASAIDESYYQFSVYSANKTSPGRRDHARHQKTARRSPPTPSGDLVTCRASRDNARQHERSNLKKTNICTRRK
jgi:hypothetical protein